MFTGLHDRFREKPAQVLLAERRPFPVMIRTEQVLDSLKLMPKPLPIVVIRDVGSHQGCRLPASPEG